MKTVLSLLLVIVSLLGILDAGYITYEKLSGFTPPCTIYFKCDQVLNSSWSSIGPVPLSAFGLLFYGVFFQMGLFFYFEKKGIKIFGYQLRTETLLALQGIFGVTFSLYLLFVMGVILKAWCLYCLLSAATCIILFVISSTIFWLSKKEKKR